MTILSTYPLITVSDLGASREFFVDHLEFRPVFEADWVVMLAHSGQDTITLGLMASHHPSSPPGPETFSGTGMVFTLQVSEATALHRRLSGKGLPIVHPLSDEPWGQRRFMLRDPSGVLVDVVEQIEPVAGFWEKYSAPG